MNKNIIIYPHGKFNLSDGGVTVQYYFAKILSAHYKQSVYIINKYDNNTINPLFNEFLNIDSLSENLIENTIVIYCEGIKGNPLNAKYVIRWMLSKLGQNVSFNHYDTWNNKELVYFFNSELEFNKYNHIKLLPVFYINTIYNDNNLHNRHGSCYTIRKAKKMIDKLIFIHPEDSFEIKRGHTQDKYMKIFNKYEYFYSYDPLTFLSLIAIMCGCISIVVEIEGVKKQDYFKMTGIYDYMCSHNLTNIYGLAYGNSDEEINYAKKTIHLGKRQILNMQQWYLNKYIPSFINDLNNFQTNENTIENSKELLLNENIENKE